MLAKKVITIFLILVNLFSFSARLDSIVNTILIDNYTESFNFNKYTTVYKSKTDLSLSELLELIENNEINPTDNNPTRGINKDYYWILFKIKTNQDLILRNSTTNIDKAYFFNIDNVTDTLVKLGTALKYSERTIKTEQIVFPINKNNNEIIYAIKIIKLYDSLSFPLILYNTDEYNSMLRLKIFLYVIFFTIMILLNVTSLIFGFILKRKIFLYYSFYSLMVIIIYGTFKNVFSSFLFPEMPVINFYLKNVSMLLVVSFNIFTLRFLNIAKYSSKIANVFKLMNVITLVFLVSSIITPYNYRYYIFSIFYIVFLVFLVFTVISVIILYRKRAQNTIVFLIAFSPVVIATIITILISFKVLPSYLLSYDLPIFGTIAEFIGFIIAILFEIKKLNDQRNVLIKETSDKERKLLMAFADGADYASSYTSIELHDNIGSQLALLKHKLSNSDNNLIIENIESIKKDMQNVSKVIDNKTVTAIGLENALINFINTFNKRSKINVSLNILRFNDIKGDKSLQLLRVIQEALTNALKYSEAESIQIILNNNTITINDNGKGFDIDEVSKKNSSGINNMKSRINKIDGQLIIKSKKGEGTEIKIIF